MDIDFTDLKGLDEYAYNTSTNCQDLVIYCQKREKAYEDPIQYYNREIKYQENIKNFKEELNRLKKSDLIYIGTYKEDPEIKWKQRKVFFYNTPKMIKLCERDYNLGKIPINLVQMHSLKGIKPVLNKERKDYNFRYFDYFLKHFWDNKEVQNSALIYKDFENRVCDKIDELLDLSLGDITKN